MNLKAYEAAHREVAFADVSDWGKLAFRGSDAKKFLHGLLTNDIQNLSSGQGLHTCILTPKGKLVADFALYDTGEELLSIQLPLATSRILEALSKPLILSETTLQDVSKQWSAVLLIGPRTAEVLRDILGAKALNAFSCAKIQQGHAWHLLSYPRYSGQGTLILFNEIYGRQLRSDLIKYSGLNESDYLDPATLEVLRIEAGIPALGIDNDENALPLEFPFEDAISFTKGCYMGQETTARIKNFGHVNRKWAGFKIGGKITIPAEVFLDGKSIGKVTSAIESPKLGARLGVGLIHADKAIPGTKVAIRDAYKEFSAELVAVPV